MATIKEDDPTNVTRSFVEGLKTEWSLLWGNLLGEEEKVAEEQDPFVTGKIEKLTLEKIKTLTKVLSHDRKKLNLSMESIRKELDENLTKLESLRLVHGETEPTEKKINELSDLGQSLSEKLGWLNERLKVARKVEKKIKDSAAPAAER